MNIYSYLCVQRQKYVHQIVNFSQINFMNDSSTMSQSVWQRTTKKENSTNEAGSEKQRWQDEQRMIRISLIFAWDPQSPSTVTKYHYRYYYHIFRRVCVCIIRPHLHCLCILSIYYTTNIRDVRIHGEHLGFEYTSIVVWYSPTH